MRWLRWLRWTLLVVAGLAVLAVGLLWWAMRQSLPQIEGTVSAAPLSAEASIERDARGIPVITAASRTDLAFATGYAHAQDRFFQMDLSRRLAAGELSELFGAVALKQDRRTRRFGFRAVAQPAIEKGGGIPGEREREAQVPNGSPGGGNKATRSSGTTSRIERETAKRTGGRY
jgi:penicillin amidase